MNIFNTPLTTVYRFETIFGCQLWSRVNYTRF